MHHIQYPPQLATLNTMFVDGGSVEEVFSPVLTGHTILGPDETVATANDIRFGLVAGIYARDIGLAMQFARDIKAGEVFINGNLQVGDTAPFEGFKESGSRRTKGLEALRNYCGVKAITTVF